MKIATWNLELGFDTMNYNVVYAQMGRGKMERAVANEMNH
jgi:argininosuccinate lyase